MRCGQLRTSTPQVVPDEPACRCARAVLLVPALLLAVAGCGPVPLPPPGESKTLVVIARPGPTTWFVGPDGAPAGFDHDLLEQFALEHRWQLRPVTADNATDLLAKIAAGEAHIGAGGLYRPDVGSKDEVPPVLWTTGYYSVEPVLIYNADGFKPKDWNDLAGARVAYLENTGVEAPLAAARAAHPEVIWEPVALPSADALIAQVDEGHVDYAIVTSTDAATARNIYLSFEVGFPAGPKRELAWAVPAGQRALRADIDAFFARMRRDGSLARLAEKYFAPYREVRRIDAGVFHERIRSMLPQYRRQFQAAQEATGIEWRLLAAIAYQESQWDPFATSETGVRGFMQLTEDTARHLGVADRLDSSASIMAAARYIRDLKAKLPARITEPDRTWLALAAFNIGLGHLEDARILAQKQRLNPDLWNDVKKALPLLAEPEYYAQAKLGYARGGMPVAFVDRVRSYYDILLRTQSAHGPRLHVPLWSGP